jgi:sec-independent protein translocase protein TatB
MFDFAWSEMGVIAVVALIFIGPKDMPVAIKAVSGAIKKARRMAGEFQTHVDELVREADLQDVREHLGDLRSFKVGRTLEKFIDEDGSLRRSFDDPMAAGSTASDTVPLDQAFVDVQERPQIGTECDPAAAELPPQAEPEFEPLDLRDDAPAFVPPPYARAARPAAPVPEPPPFIPPAFAAHPAPRP